jgi:(R,R)-butanediol dehydrogenase/meso-butanediol dehydrogenase/diacetyl reductase
MKACVFKSTGAPLQMTDVPEPIAEPGEIVVRVKNCGVCGSDLHAAKFGFNMPPGTIMGHEFSGVIEELGSGVEGFERGDPVVVMSYLACGQCLQCRSGSGSGCRNMRLVGFGDVPGAYAELMKTRPGSVFKMPPGMNHRVAATVEPSVVGLHGIHRAGLRAGESCIIMGAGPIGLVTLQWAQFAGAKTIVVSELAEGRRTIAAKMGATAVVDPRKESPADVLSKIDRTGADVVFECIGVPGTLAEACNFARRNSRVVVLGACMEEDRIAPMLPMNKELDIRFSLGLERGEIETVISMLSSGRVRTEPMITDIVKIENLPDAFATLSRPNSQTKVMVEF